MNTIKIFKINDNDFLIKINENLKYMVTNGAVLKVNINTESLEETIFDIIVQSQLDNAISNIDKIVTSVDQLNLLQAIVQEKIEDFD